MQCDQFLAELPIEQRLALAYAPRSSRDAVLALLTLDNRLAAIVRSSREAVLGQLRLAWWRDELTRPTGRHSQGEPLLTLLGEQLGSTQPLAALASGWEQMLGEGEVSEAGLAELVGARAAAFVAIGQARGCVEEDAIACAARIWSCGDLAAKLSNPVERARANALFARQGASVPRLPRALRSLSVLAGLAQRQRGRDGGPLASGPGALATSLRIGLLGF